MYTNNPYAQGGWYNPSNPHSADNRQPQQNTGYPPTYGALPSPMPPPPPSIITFFFVNPRPNILNCTVTGPRNLIYFQISTDTLYPEVTTIAKLDGGAAAILEWHLAPVVEVRGAVVVPRQCTSQWLALSQDRNYRTMAVHGRVYSWIPRGDGICLYTTGPNPTQLGRILRTGAAVTLEITPEANQAGILEAIVAATVLLQCGKQID